MDFEHVLKALVDAFGRHEIRYAAIGGFAMGALGAGRMTRDLDFLVDRDDMPRLHEALTQLGYERSASTENVSHYRHADGRWVGIDVLHAFRALARDMITRAAPHPIFRNTASVAIAAPEDVIALKVQAIANNPHRRLQDQADIERLMELYRDRLDWDQVQRYYELFDLGEEGRELRRRFGDVQRRSDT